ncbi:GNAT family N-acetyltransferase [Planococcus shenhongbingii]|uniref:GNAT family N-acetyltransferase n=1 Tax=Planococcus shenhongbingii TaxID=3058398 RepID=UPI002604AD68|nr:GNAT family N-acetyltransferase [Planococcus sp. N016]WKA57728.1 GNAT family N-acetyltransferase [Planococcus sp. N016]
MDIFFEENYGKLYEEIENGKCEVYTFNHPLGIVKHLFIKREVPIQIGSETYYDIVTPYGYGGPVIIEGEDANKAELVQEFKKAFQQYCSEQNIISEFVRFHPVLNNAKDFTDCYEVTFTRKTVGTNLGDHDDPVQAEFSKSTRKNIRHAMRIGVDYRITVNPENLDLFKDIYQDNMKRIGADMYYYFDESYFAKCLKFFGEKIILVEALYEEKVIGAELHFFYNNIIHTHLSGTLADFHHLSPVYVMTYGIAVWGKENGAELIHAGGGTTNSPDDTLYLFKKKFGKNTEFDFYVGRKVWNECIYDELCAAARVEKEVEFFPAYRSKKAEQVSEIQNVQG